MLIINFKTYKESTGENAVNLARAALELKGDSDTEIVLCPQAVDLRQVVEVYPNVWVQHADFVKRGRATGFLPVEIVKETGAVGLLINHSEHTLSDSVISSTVNECKVYGIKSLVFAGDIDKLKKVVEYSPDFVSYEPPELVGSTTETVTTAHPNVIKAAADVARANSVPLIVGAGVHTVDDVVTSLKLGASGIAVATGVVKSENPKAEMEKLLSGFDQ